MIHIKNPIKIGIDPFTGKNCEYIKEWKDLNGNFLLGNYLPKNRNILNKISTGCGITTWCLENKENVILVSPRTKLIRNKIEQGSNLYYYNREIKAKKSFQQLQDELSVYLNYCKNYNLPIKILVTYDSFVNLSNLLETIYFFNISETFRICIDECHTLIKDVKLKEFCNKGILSGFLSKVFTYSNLLFISATPIVEYIKYIPEFQNYDVDYYELVWSSLMKVSSNFYSCKSPLNAFDQVYDKYSKSKNNLGYNYFDTIYYGNGVSVYSYQAVIFLNSIQDIKRIINKYVNKLGLIDINDISIICSENPNNEPDLKKVNKNLKITVSIPKQGDPHKIWTFVTRTAFEGVDFYSDNASTYVFANYNVECLAIDIGSDIKQIVGRQRLKENLFRGRINIFFVGSKIEITDEEFDACQKQRLENSNNQIKLYENASPELKNLALNNLEKVILSDPNELYISTINGFPEINQLLIISENYCRDIISSQSELFIMASSFDNNFSVEAQNLRTDLFLINSQNLTQERLKKTYEYFVNYPNLHEEFFRILCSSGLDNIAYYFNTLSLERIHSNWFHPTKLDNEINFNNQSSTIINAINQKFIKGNIYSKSEVKTLLQEVYDSLGIKKIAKASELELYISISGAKKNGLKAYRIL